MGWLWNSDSNSKDTTTTSSNTDNLSPPTSTSTTTTTPTTPTTSPPQQPPPKPSKKTDEEEEEAALLAFLSSLESEPSPTPHTPLTAIASLTSSRPPPPFTLPPQNPAQDPSNPSPTSPPPRPLLPTHIHPTTLSCRAAFDQAFACQSLGGQFQSIYRHGVPRSCSPHWADFWFCLRTNRRRMDEGERAARVLARARDRDRDRYRRDGPSSQDVWRQREVLVEGAFEGDLEELERREGMRWGG